MSNVWFSADTHFNHFKIIEYTNRPFKTVEEMNETIIANWNSRVKPEDTVILNGDFCFKNDGTIKAIDWEKRLNGKIVFIKGNHDNNNSCSAIIENMVIKYGGKQLFIVHDPANCNLNYDINLTAHVHEKWKVKEAKSFPKKSILINIGVDVWNFMPVTINQILAEYSKFVKEEKKDGCEFIKEA